MTDYERTTVHQTESTDPAVRQTPAGTVVTEPRATAVRTTERYAATGPGNAAVISPLRHVPVRRPAGRLDPSGHPAVAGRQPGQ